MKFIILASLIAATQAGTIWKGWSPTVGCVRRKWKRVGRKWKLVCMKTQYLKVCEGDCDADWHCAGDLKCLQSNDAGSILSGCDDGVTHSDADYCYNPKFVTKDSKELQEHGWSPQQLKGKKLKGGKVVGKIGLCNGDCDHNNQCRKGLKCYQSSSDKDILTGCKGKTVGAYDYCYDPLWVTTDSKKLEQHGWNANTMGKIGLCKGDCDANHQCRKGLICYQSSSDKDILTGCEGKTVGALDYCYDPTWVTTDSKKLERHGWNAHTMGKLGLCKGDCDVNHQCRKGLKCYQSSSNKDVLTGCTGKTDGAVDYCYDPTWVTSNSKTLERHGWNANTMGKIGMCKGDCDSDAQCVGTMKCFQSHKWGDVVTGCKGKTQAAVDYCYQPNRGDPVHCHDWNCEEWCKYFDDALVATYAKEGCADDGSDSCPCL